MSRGTVLAGVLIACGVAAAVLLSRGGSAGDDENVPAAGAIPATPDSRDSPGAAPISRDRPHLVAPAPAVTIPEMPFADEPVDRDVAADRTALVRATVDQAISGAGAGVSLEQVECRSQRCRLTLAGTGLTEVLARLEDERGFYGKASELALHDLVNGDDGQPLRVSMTLTFAARPTPGEPSPADE